MPSAKLPVIADAASFEAHFHDRAWLEAAAVICARHALSHSGLRRSVQAEHVVFFVDDAFVIKIYSPFRDGYRRETSALEVAAGAMAIETPRVIHDDELEGWSYVVMTQLPGLPAREAWPQVRRAERIDLVTALGQSLRSLHGSRIPVRTALDQDWAAFIEFQTRTAVERQRTGGAPPDWLQRLPGFIEERLPGLPTDVEPVFLHGDVHLGNLLLAREGGRWCWTGLVDFADCRSGFHEYELVAPGVLMVQGDRDLQRSMLAGYGYAEAELDEALRARLMLLTVLYECSNLRKYALRLRPDAVDYSLDQLERAIWTFAGD